MSHRWGDCLRGVPVIVALFGSFVLLLLVAGRRAQ